MSEPVRILYVDDSAADRALVRDALEREPAGFALTETESLEEFQARLNDGTYDLVLTDFHILGVDGFCVVDSVRALRPNPPIVIVKGRRRRLLEPPPRGTG